jgi:hypothetical protein
MKRIVAILLFSLIVGFTSAQNFQVLNGIGSDKSYVNFVTAELFKPLDHGKFYGFTDLKLNKNGYFDSYTELFGYLNIGKKGYSITGQVDAGLFTVEGTGVQIYPVYLLGISKEAVINDWVLTLDVLYRMDRGLNLEGLKIGNGAQLTGTFLKDGKHLQFSGYCDLYQTENSQYYNKNRQSLIVQFEPQLWWKFSKRVFLGVEGRISNFTDPDLGLYNYSSYAMVGLKFNLE